MKNYLYSVLTFCLLIGNSWAVPSSIHCEVVSGNERRGSLEMILDANGGVTRVTPNLVVGGKRVPPFTNMHRGSSYGRIATRRGSEAVSTEEVNASSRTGEGINFTTIFLRAPVITEAEVNTEYFDRNFVTQLFGLTRNPREYGALRIANPQIREYRVLCAPNNISAPSRVGRNNSSNREPRDTSSGPGPGRSATDAAGI